MNLRSFILSLIVSVAILSSAGCNSAPGKPGPGPAVARPDQLLDFSTLYAQNCASCHGVNGKNGAAISLANPVYLAVAGVSNIQRVTSLGVPHTEMPPFARSAGGMLTDRQIAVLSQQMVAQWGNPSALSGITPPPYAASTKGDPVAGKRAFIKFCSYCHIEAFYPNGLPTGAVSILLPQMPDKLAPGSLIDPAYLALISDQGLRSIILAGQTEQGAHDWRSYTPGHPMTDQDVTDIVAWLTSHRIATPGQPYPSHP
jgi:cytochrome c oxidase cbb3-type subunit 3/ubiquinol-cytochrome c reductase cytochrome c subunit